MAYQTCHGNAQGSRAKNMHSLPSAVHGDARLVHSCLSDVLSAPFWHGEYRLLEVMRGRTLRSLGLWHGLRLGGGDEFLCCYRLAVRLQHGHSDASWLGWTGWNCSLGAVLFDLGGRARRVVKARSPQGQELILRLWNACIAEPATLQAANPLRA